MSLVIRLKALRPWPLTAVCAVASLALPAGAAEYCVTCAGPAAMYACTIEGDAPGTPSDPRAQLVCIQELARQGGHETCSVPRSAPSPCPGTVKAVAVPAGGAPALAVVEQAPEAPSALPPAAQKQTAEPEKPDKPPRTVKELAEQTVDASKQGLNTAGKAVTGTVEKAGEQVGKAGNAVSHAAQKTWDCLKSLFSGC